jgi:hypothetical protein
MEFPDKSTGKFSYRSSARSGRKTAHSEPGSGSSTRSKAGEKNRARVGTEDEEGNAKSALPQLVKILRSFLPSTWPRQL